MCGNNNISTGCGTAPSALSLGTDGKTPEVSDFYFLASFQRDFDDLEGGLDKIRDVDPRISVFL